MKSDSHAVKTRVVGEGVILPHLDEASAEAVTVMVSKGIRLSRGLILTAFGVLEEVIERWQYFP